MLNLQKILRSTVYPVMGCTEPAAVALASSLAAQMAKGTEIFKEKKVQKSKNISDIKNFMDVEFVRVRTSRSIFKNAMAVGIPGAGKASGIYMSAAMGVFLPAREGLNLFKYINKDIFNAACNILNSGRLELEVDERDEEIFIEAMVLGKVDGIRHAGEAVISGGHTRVTLLRRDGKIINGSDLQWLNDTGRKQRVVTDMQNLTSCSIKDLIDMTEKLTERDIDFLFKGVKLNRNAARKGIELRLGLGIGATISEMIKEGKISDDVFSRVRMETAAAADARMSGFEVEIMSSSGSGNQGIMAIIPVAIVSEFIKEKPKNSARALALSHLITACMTEGVGLLSALCGCVIKAGIGATAGIAWLISKNERVVEGAISNMVGNIVGEVCDGAKVGCALKLSTAASAAVESAELACRGICVPWTNGIVGRNFQETFSNLQKIAMSTKATDRAIIEIINKKQKAQIAIATPPGFEPGLQA